MPVRRVVLMLAVVGFGCGGVASEEGVEPVAPETTEQPATVTSCGSTLSCSPCPAGQHPTARTCSSTCGGTGNCGPYATSANAWMCAPNTDAFYQCGTTCPTGYLVYKYDRFTYCDSGAPTTGNNRVLCGKF